MTDRYGVIPARAHATRSKSVPSLPHYGTWDCDISFVIICHTRLSSESKDWKVGLIVTVRRERERGWGDGTTTVLKIVDSPASSSVRPTWAGRWSESPTSRFAPQPVNKRRRKREKFFSFTVPVFGTYAADSSRVSARGEKGGGFTCVLVSANSDQIRAGRGLLAQFK